MKKILLFFISALFLLTSVPLSTKAIAQDRAHILKVYNWADYLDLSLIEEFEAWYKEQTGEDVKVRYSTFDINENMLTQIEVGHEDYDVVCPSEYIIERMLKRGLLQKIDTTGFARTHTPNWLRNVAPFRPVRGREIPADGSKRRRQVRPRQSLASCQRLCRRLHGRNNRFPLQHRFRPSRGGGNLGCSLERKVPAENLREGCLSRCLFCFDSVCQVRRYLERTNSMPTSRQLKIFSSRLVRRLLVGKPTSARNA